MQGLRCAPRRACVFLFRDGGKNGSFAGRRQSSACMAPRESRRPFNARVWRQVDARALEGSSSMSNSAISASTSIGISLRFYLAMVRTKSPLNKQLRGTLMLGRGYSRTVGPVIPRGKTGSGSDFSCESGFCRIVLVEKRGGKTVSTLSAYQSSWQLTAPDIVGF